MNSFRYEKEFEILEQLTEKLVAVRASAIRLRPIFDMVDPNQPEEERKKERLQNYNDAAVALNQTSETRRPFYPEIIYNLIRELNDVAYSEAISFQMHGSNEPKEFNSYWKEARENSEKIIEIAEKTMQAIRDRVVSWEDS